MTREVAGKTRLDERKVRTDFLNCIKERVEAIEAEGEIVGKNYGEKDDWILVTDSLDMVFRVIFEVLDHNTGYNEYEKIPLEIAIGNGEYDKWARFDGTKLIVERSTIEFLKTKIIGYYHNWYRRIHSNEPPTSTFAVFTNAVYDELSPLDKEMFQKIESKHYRDNARMEEIMTFFVADLDRVLRRGKTFQFLGKINKSNDWYSKIDRIFVSSNEYADIIESVEKKKVVFLVGDPEIGKTFTAVRIMWEYYCKGYTPVWHSGSEFFQRVKIREIMSATEIQNHSVVCFEDPFGKIRFEDREELRRTIGNFFQKVQDIDAKVIITSREEPFKEFEKEKLSQINLRAFSIEMNLMKPSYTKEKMEEILLNWATEFDCQWLQKEELKSLVIKEAAEKLTTPLSLREFALVSKDCCDLNTINALIKEKSKETKKAFAEEIANMNKEKVLFLSMIYILPVPETKKIEAIYDKICRKFRLNLETNSFEYLKKWFGTKITHDPNIGFKFAHSSYEEGLIQSWNRIEVKNFILKTINELIKEDAPEMRGSCGFRLIENFEEISFKDEAKHLIGTLLHDKNAIARYGVALAIRYNFNNLPKSLALGYLNRIAKDRHREIRAIAVEIVGKFFKKIPRQESLKLISKCLEDRAAWVRLYAISSVTKNIEKLPYEVVMIALKRCRELCNFSNWVINYFAVLTCTSLEKEAKKLKPIST